MSNDVSRMYRKRLWWALPAVFVGFALAVRWLAIPAETSTRDQSLDALVHQLDGDEHEGRGAQEELMKRIPKGDITLWKRLLESPNANTRYFATDSIAESVTPESAPILEGLLRDNYSKVRGRAIEAFGTASKDVGIRPLIAGLQDEDCDIRETAVTQLKMLNDKRAVPALIRAVHDKDNRVSSPAMHLLRRFTGQPWRTSVRDDPAKYKEAEAKWDAWWKENQAKWDTDPGLRNIGPIRPMVPTPQAPNFDVESIDGSRLKLADVRGKVVLLNMWATWCGPCKAEIPELAGIARDHGPSGVEVIGLSVQDKDNATIRKFARENGIGYKLGIANDAVRDAYSHVHELPVSFLIDRQGRIRYQWEGARDRDTFEAAIQRLLSEK